MKTIRSKNALPSPLRLVIYLALIAAFCLLNCLIMNVRIKGQALVEQEGRELPYMSYEDAR
jgi:hypothetical protein